MPKPQATEYTKVSSSSVRPTTAMARSPKRLTKKMSTSANTASIPISRIMGMLSSTMARRTPIAVQSRSSPPSDSFSMRHNFLITLTIGKGKH